MDLVYAGDAEFTVQACGFRGGLKQIVVGFWNCLKLSQLIPLEYPVTPLGYLKIG